MTLLANPWAIAILGAALVGVTGGAYLKGRSDGRALEFAERATIDEIARTAREEAIQAAAEAIAQIKVTHTTIRGRVEREIIERPVYRDCVHSDDTLRLLNDALANKAPQPVDSGQLPGPVAP